MSHIISKDGKIYKGSSAAGPVVLCVKDGKVYKSSSPAGPVSLCVKDGKVYKSTSPAGPVSLCVKDGKIYKSSSAAGPTLNINSTIHSAIKDSKKYDLASVVAAYHFLIKPIF